LVTGIQNKKEGDMKFLATVAAGLAVGVCATGIATAQGPVREGIRRTGEAAAEGTRSVAEGTANVARGVAEGTADVARGVGEATVGAARATGRAAGAAVGITPDTPLQARAGASLSAADQGRDARWRFSRQNGEWWYYTPENNWMYHRDGQWNEFAEDTFQPLNQNQQFAQGQQQFSAGYRGVEQQGQFDQGFQQQVRTDRWGRQYICENGRPVYLDQGQPMQAQGQPGALAPTPAPGEYGVGYRGVEGQRLQGEQAAPAPAADAELQQGQAQPAQPQPAQPPATAAPEGAQAQPQDQATESPTAPKEERNEPDTSGAQ